VSASYGAVQASGGGSGVSGTIASGLFTSTTGRALIAFLDWDNASSRTITGLAGGGTGITWTSAIAKFVDSRGNQALQVYIGTGYTGGVNVQVTATLSGTTGFRGISVVEVAGQDATQFDGGQGVGWDTDTADAGTAVDSNAIVPVSDDTLILACCVDWTGTNSITKGASYTQINNFDPYGGTHQTEYRTANLSPAGSVTADWTLSSTESVANVIVAIRSAVTAGKAMPVFTAQRLMQRTRIVRRMT
jgi:hypothetical protein